MSAIWGFINLNEKDASQELGESMLIPFKKCKIDKFDYIKKNNVFFGCGLQYITLESKVEVLPYVDKDSKLIITADAIIDNRDELADKLKISKRELEKTADSKLILASYILWGKDCVNHLLGNFAFVIWDEAKKEAFCARDHVGSRCLYYYLKDGILIFSTLIKPILSVVGKQTYLNERWLVDFIELEGAAQHSEVTETIYSDILQVEPATYVQVDSNCEIVKQRYWNPLNNLERLKLKSDEEYKEKFNNILKECVNCNLRTNDKVGILLSGGLDSSVIACIAADILSNKNQELLSYTSVPKAGYKSEYSKYFITNETKEVQLISEFSKNIKVKFCESEGLDSYNVSDYYLDVLEHPYRTLENSLWLDDIYKEAARDGCKILLTGQFGNATISFGDLFTQIHSLLKKCDLIKISKEVCEYGKLHRAYKKDIVKAIIKIYTHNHINHGDSYLKDDMQRKWSVKERFKNAEIKYCKFKFYKEEEFHKLMFDWRALAQMGEIETKLSLANGVIPRDPSRDKRIIELCLSLPVDQFYKNGIDRRLVREYAEGIIPDEIRTCYTQRGIQAADWIDRLNDRWDEIYPEFIEISESKFANKYFNIDKLKENLARFENGLVFEESQIIREVIIMLITIKYITNYNECKLHKYKIKEG